MCLNTFEIVDDLNPIVSSTCIAIDEDGKLEAMLLKAMDDFVIVECPNPIFSKDTESDESTTSINDPLNEARIEDGDKSDYLSGQSEASAQEQPREDWENDLTVLNPQELEILNKQKAELGLKYKGAELSFQCKLLELGFLYKIRGKRIEELERENKDLDSMTRMSFVEKELEREILDLRSPEYKIDSSAKCIRSRILKRQSRVEINLDKQTPLAKSSTSESPRKLAGFFKDVNSQVKTIIQKKFY